MDVYHQPGTVQYALRLDCNKNGCLDKFGFKHSDDGDIKLASHSQPNQTINGHETVLLTRTIPDWQEV